MKIETFCSPWLTDFHTYDLFILYLGGHWIGHSNYTFLTSACEIWSDGSSN